MANIDKLSNVRDAFKTWRIGRTGKQRIFDELWQKAVALLKNYRISHVAKELKLNAGQLREKQVAFIEQNRSKEMIQQQQFSF